MTDQQKKLTDLIQSQIEKHRFKIPEIPDYKTPYPSKIPYDEQVTDKIKEYTDQKLKDLLHKMAPRKPSIPKCEACEEDLAYGETRRICKECRIAIKAMRAFVGSKGGE